MKKVALPIVLLVLCSAPILAGAYLMTDTSEIVDDRLEPRPHVPVVIVPGILGSMLVDASTGRDRLLWPGTIMLGADIDSLRLPPTGKGNLGFEIRATGLMGFAEAVSALEAFERSPIARFTPGWLREWIPDTVRSLSYYGGIIAAFQSAGYIPDVDLFTFPYDWRRDLLDISLLLASRIADILDQTGAEAVDIVAHSMGGLLARAYVNTVDSPPVRKLIMMGTPSHGSPDAFVALHSELGNGKLLLEDKNAQELSTNWPSVFQLLPTPEYFELYGHVFDDQFGENHEGALTGAGGDAAWHRTYLENPDSSLADVNEYLLTTAETYSARAFHERIGTTLQFAGELVIIAGSGTSTVGTVMKADSTESTWYGVPTNGDGTVPLLSVTRLESSGPISIYHTTASHEGMLSDAAVGRLLPALLSSDDSAVSAALDGDHSLRREVSISDGREDEAFTVSTSVVLPLR
ncbi:MAG: alpha/beta fold hydrolase [Candidatus Bipolaricaulota bacterium]